MDDTMPPPVRCKHCPTWLRSGNKDGVCQACKVKRASRDETEKTQIKLEPAMISTPMKRPYKALTLDSARAMTPPPDKIGEKVSELRQAMFDAFSAEDIGELMRGQMAKAKAGDPGALKLILGLIGNGSAGSKQQIVVVQQNAGAVPQNGDE